MTTATLPRRALTILVCLAVAAPIAIYLWIALHRVDYPYELDWMEGGSVELAARVLGGHSLYVAPSIKFVGWTYPPLYYWRFCCFRGWGEGLGARVARSVVVCQAAMGG